MAFLDQICGRQSIALEFEGKRNHQTHMRLCQLVQGFLILVLRPANRQIHFLIALKVRRIGCSLDNQLIGIFLIRHDNCPFDSGLVRRCTPEPANGADEIAVLFSACG